MADSLRELHAEWRGDAGATQFFGTLVWRFVVGGHTDFDEMGMGFVREAVEVAILGGFVVGLGGHGWASS